ncbi:transcriptional regulator [Streptococcus infantarius subsp. infantarius]|nr:transcriptional regulator [Streptococcus infantarius subsp. infantarius]
MNLVVFDIGGTSVKYGRYQDSAIDKKGAFATPKTWEKMKANLYRVFTELSDADAKGVAISSPGAVDTEEGVIKGFSAIPYIHHFKIIDELEAMFGLPVTIENDANCAGLAESQFGIGKDSKKSIYFILGTGIGGAVCLDGKLYKGSSLYGGEFGFMIIKDGITLSNLASPVAVAKKYAKEHGLTDFTGKDLFDLADAGNSDAKAALSEMYDVIAIGIFNCLVSINPDLVGIGGGISVREDLVPELEKRLQKLVEKTDAHGLDYQVKTCQFRNDANLLGAVSNFLNSR